MRPVRIVIASLLLGLVVAATPSAAAPRLARLTDIRVAHHPGFDRVVFDFNGPLPTDVHVRYVDELIADGSGKRVRIAGRAILQVVFEGTRAHDAAGNPTAPRRVAYDTKNVITAVQSGDFEATVGYGIGLLKREPRRVFTLTDPSRVVVDIETTFRTVRRRVYFLDEARFEDGTEPYVRSVLRHVRRSRPATGVLDRLYAGPTRAERRDDLRLVRSHTTGFKRLSIEDGIADLRLRGPCSSDGSTFTIANHIFPSLKQFATVDWVKIRDRFGQTADPTGSGDSIPACLEP